MLILVSANDAKQSLALLYAKYMPLPIGVYCPPNWVVPGYVARYEVHCLPEIAMLRRAYDDGALCISGAKLGHLPSTQLVLEELSKPQTLLMGQGWIIAKQQYAVMDIIRSIKAKYASSKADN